MVRFRAKYYVQAGKNPKVIAGPDPMVSRQSSVQNIMDVQKISFDYFMMLSVFVYSVLHLWFVTLAVSGLRNIYATFMFMFFFFWFVFCEFRCLALAWPWKSMILRRGIL